MLKFRTNFKMKTILSAKTLAAFVLAFSCNHAMAQMSMARQAYMQHKHYMNARANGKKLKSYLSYEVGYHYPISQATFNHTYVNEVNGMYTGEKTISRSLKGKGFGGHGGVYYPLFHATEKSVVALNVGAVVNILKYDIGEIRPTDTRVYNYSFASAQASLPLTMDYKYGGEAMYDKAEKVSFTAGFGLSPTLYMANFGPAPYAKLGLRPYVHAELGFFAFIEWKVYASCMMGNATIFKGDNETAGLENMPFNSRISMDAKPVFSIGFSTMPFSWDWENSRW